MTSGRETTLIIIINNAKFVSNFLIFQNDFEVGKHFQNVFNYELSPREVTFHFKASSNLSGRKKVNT